MVEDRAPAERPPWRDAQDEVVVDCGVAEYHVCSLFAMAQGAAPSRWDVAPSDAGAADAERRAALEREARARAAERVALKRRVLKSRMARRLSRFRLRRPVARSLLCRAFHLEQRTRISRGVALLRHMND